VLNELFDKIHYEMGGPANPMPYTNVEQFETVEIDWEGDEKDLLKFALIIHEMGYNEGSYDTSIVMGDENV
jgi:hypothetical protein